MLGKTGFLLFWVSCIGANAAISLPPLFSDHMVLQRERDVPIWGGDATPGVEVTVKFRGKETAVLAGPAGKWRAEILTGEAGGPFKLTIRCGEDEQILTGVLVGEVWLGAGQSNMRAPARVFESKDKSLQQLLEGAPYPRIRFLRLQGDATEGWKRAGENSVPHWPALMLAYGHRLSEELDVPIGLMVGAVASTPSVHWLSEDALDRDDACLAALEDYAEYWDPKRAQRRHKRDLEHWEDAKVLAKKEGSRTPRKPFPPVDPGYPIRGGEVGYEELIRPVTGFGIRGVLWDQGEAGSGLGGVEQDLLMHALIAGWRRDWSQGDFPFLCVQKPSGGGPAWDTSNPVTRMAVPFGPLPDLLEFRADGEVHGIYSRIREFPNTWLITTTDLGAGFQPTDKWGYAQRAANVALHAAYEREIPVYGPVYDSHNIEGSLVRIQFAHTGESLKFRGGNAVQGFQVAGDDGVYHWAAGEIEGKDSVLVQSKAVERPLHVRYAWARERSWANLFNSHGLPALSFTTENRN
ncbi:MAG: sialate O-acetylesterase [Verrucomicrobiales bacterium]|jgi:sialate O-acetylesterase